MRWRVRRGGCCWDRGLGGICREQDEPGRESLLVDRIVRLKPDQHLTSGWDHFTRNLQRYHEKLVRYIYLHFLQTYHNYLSARHSFRNTPGFAPSCTPLRSSMDFVIINTIHMIQDMRRLCSQRLRRPSLITLSIANLFYKPEATPHIWDEAKPVDSPHPPPTYKFKFLTRLVDTTISSTQGFVVRLIYVVYFHVIVTAIEPI